MKIHFLTRLSGYKCTDEERRYGRGLQHYRLQSLKDEVIQTDA